MQPGPGYRWLLTAIVGLAMISIGVSQAHAAKSARVGMFWDTFGNSGEEGWGGTAMVWPGGFWKEDLGGENFAKASISYKGFLYGFQNFTVPPVDSNWTMLPDVIPGTELPHYVVVRDIKNSPGINGLQLIPETVELTYRSDPAVVTTDGVLNNPPDYGDLPEDPSLPADVRIVSKWRNNAGVQSTRTVYAFAHPDHDDYHIWHYNFENTGRYCCGKGMSVGDADAVFDQTLHNFHFSHSFWFMDRAEGGRRTHQSGEHTGDNLNNYKGHAVTAPYAPSANITSDTKEIVGQLYGMSLGSASSYDQLRVQYAWDGDGPGYLGEDSGDPELITGRMMSARWPGVALIHADIAYNDGADDPDQPKRSDYDNHNRMPQLLESEGPDYKFLYKTMTPDGPLVEGGLNNRFQEDAIRSGVPYAGNATNVKFRGAETILSVGDWELPLGEDVNAIWVSGVGGIPYDETVELGKRLRLSDADLEAEGLTRLTEQERLTKFFALEDELFTVLQRAQRTITRDVSTLKELDARLATQDVQTPPNAATFAVNAGSGQINLSWTAPNTRANEVSSYRVYRARGSRVGDFPWTEVYSGSATSYDDTDVAVGIDYFYYVVTVNSAGVESSPHLARTQHGVSPSTEPETAVGDVYVVPNPYDARYQLGTFQAAAGEPLPGFAENVVFYGLPANATIIVYTLDGVQIKRIEHVAAEGTAGQGTEAWDLTTDTGLPIVSGVYIYAVDSDAGDAIGKLVVVR